MIYVNMNDKFLSGWGHAAGGRSIYCIECDTREQADAVERAALDRPEMKYVTIAGAPRKGRKGDHVKIEHVSGLGGPWLSYMQPRIAKRAPRYTYYWIPQFAVFNTDPEARAGYNNLTALMQLKGESPETIAKVERAHA